jgi:hypothetical protein
VKRNQLGQFWKHLADLIVKTAACLAWDFPGDTEVRSLIAHLSQPVGDDQDLLCVSDHLSGLGHHLVHDLPFD